MNARFLSAHLSRVKTSSRRVGAKKHPLFLRVSYLYVPTPRHCLPHHLPGVGIRGYGEAKKFRDDGKQIVEKKLHLMIFFSPTSQFFPYRRSLDVVCLNKCGWGQYQKVCVAAAMSCVF